MHRLPPCRRPLVVVPAHVRFALVDGAAQALIAPLCQRNGLISQDVIVSYLKSIVVSSGLTKIPDREATITPHARGERAQASGSLRLSPGEPILDHRSSETRLPEDGEHP